MGWTGREVKPGGIARLIPGAAGGPVNTGPITPGRRCPPGLVGVILFGEAGIEGDTDPGCVPPRTGPPWSPGLGGGELFPDAGSADVVVSGVKGVTAGTTGAE